MSKLLVKEKKGATYRLFDLDTEQTVRAFQRDFKDIDFIIGTLFECEYTDNGCLNNLDVKKEILGDSQKQRVEVHTDDIKIGDLVDGVPVLNLGQKYVKDGQKMAYAYFRESKW
jgi:hypothetical protein